MNISITDIFFLLLMLFFFSQLSSANDTINTSRSIKYNQTLVSSRGVFEVGFFSPGNSKKWYLGIWYKNITPKTVVWVANRENPLRNSISAELKLTQTGLLVILDEKNDNIWSPNISGLVQNPVLQLLDSGNLVLREENDNNYLWQSFHDPTDTYLPGMAVGTNSVTGVVYQLSSWKNEEDPAPGDFTLDLDPSGYPQVFIRRRGVIQNRVGPWNGVAFSGLPHGQIDSIEFKIPTNKKGASHYWKPTGNSVITKVTLNPNGDGQRRTWVDQTQEWVLYGNIPTDYCDNYKSCGVHGSCRIGYIPACGCLDRFVPKDPEGWAREDWSKGCVRRKPLNCEGGGDGFLKYSGIKLPDARNTWYNESMTLEGCKVECLKNCNCTAYTNLDIRNRGSGCLLWFGDLVDNRVLSAGGQDLYIRMASSELDLDGEKLVLSLIAVGMGLLGLSSLLYIWKRMKNNRKRRKIGADLFFSTDLLVGGNHTFTHNKDLELPLFDLSTISKATDNFSVKSKLGEGGYGPVYKGNLEGQDIAVKRLSKSSKQGLDEFKNEVICIAKLQHRNLVKLLGCCIQEDEKMLIYEYMPNKSLDLVLFDDRKRAYLDWPKRFHIVNGIARGLVYLHQDSRLRIIHRDLKASNVLLDNEMNPKISDFGLAKIFRGNESEDKTSRVMGTYGYMSPEYAVHGRFSVKSDIFSFGVLVLEIISGKRNSSFSHEDHHTHLLGHAWKLYKEGRSMELVDTSLQDSASLGEVLRLIHIGLLCVQQHPDDRPTTTSVVSMLSNEVLLPQVNCPGFFTENDTYGSESKHERLTAAKSINEVTITMPHGR